MSGFFAFTNAVKKTLYLSLPAGVMFGWSFVIFLSGTLYQDNDSVISGTLFCAIVFCSFLVFGIVVLRIPMATISVKQSVPFAIIGTGCALLVSLLLLIPSFAGLVDLLSVLVCATLTGIVLACLFTALVLQLSSLSFVETLVWFITSFVVGITLYVLYMSFIPKPALLLGLGAFPFMALIGALAFIKQTNALPSQETFAHSIKYSQKTEIFSQREFSLFTLVSGFLFSYCYNVYPKSTRFVGTHSDIAVGFSSFADLTYLLTCLTILCFVLLGFWRFKGNHTLLFGSLVIIVLAIIYFVLPSMENNWFVFVLLESLATFSALFAVLGCITLFSSGRHDVFHRCLEHFIVGLAVGSCLALIFIETTVPEPRLIIPKIIRDILIVGTPSVGFIVLLIIIFVLERSSIFPAASENAFSPSVSSSDLNARCHEVAHRFALTSREEEILTLLLQGRSGPYIQEDLYVSKSTVKTHIRHIYSKTGVSSRQELINLVRLGRF